MVTTIYYMMEYLIKNLAEHIYTFINLKAHFFSQIVHYIFFIEHITENDIPKETRRMYMEG